MERYLVFSGENYYPLGGWEDFRNSYDSEAEARNALDLLVKGEYVWGHVVDTQKGFIVFHHGDSD